MDLNHLHTERANAQHRIELIDRLRRGEKISRVELDAHPDLQTYLRKYPQDVSHSFGGADMPTYPRVAKRKPADPFYEGLDPEGQVDSALLEKLHGHGLHVGKDCVHREFLPRLLTALRTKRHAGGKPPLPKKNVSLDEAGAAPVMLSQTNGGKAKVYPAILDRLTNGRWSAQRAKKEGGK
jgi:hypothetical protein